MCINIMLQKSPFLQSPFLQPRPTAESLNCLSYRGKIFYTEMVDVNRKTLCTQTLKLSRVMRKLEFAYAKTKAQIICAADQHLCFRYIDSTIPLLSKCKAISCGCMARFLLDLVGNPEDNFLAPRLNF